MGLVSELQILTEPRGGPLKISRSLLKDWNRFYQRYRLNRFYPPIKPITKMKNPTDEIALLREQLAQTEKLLQQEKLKREALDIMIGIAEKDGAARAVQDSNPKKVWPRWRTTPNGRRNESTSPFGEYEDTLRAVASALRLGRAVRLGMICRSVMINWTFII